MPALKLLVLSARDVHELLPYGECADLVAGALAALARGEAYQPLRTMIQPPSPDGSSPAGLMALMPAHEGTRLRHHVRRRGFRRQPGVSAGRTGDVRLALAEHSIPPVHIRAEIGELLTGTGPMPGRPGDRDITVFESLGLAVEDLAAAQGVYRKAARLGAGTWVDF